MPTLKELSLVYTMVLFAWLLPGCEATTPNTYPNNTGPSGDSDVDGDTSVDRETDADSDNGGVPPVEDCKDADGDRYGVGVDCIALDCDDEDPEIHPNKRESCADGIDNDCDDKVDGADESCATTCADITDEPCVELHPGEDYREKVLSVPTSGGVLLVMPGEYQVTEPPYFTGRSYLKIIGVMENGDQRPRLYSTEDQPVGTAIMWAGDTNGDLTIENMEIDHFSVNCISAGGGSKPAGKQTVDFKNISVHHCGGKTVMISFEQVGGPYDDVFICDECEMHTVRETHVLYVDRVKEARITNGKFYNPGSLHPFKVIAVNLHVVGNEISNGLLDGSGFRPADDDWILPGKSISGTSSMSLVACQKGLVANNTIRYVFDNTGHRTADRQQRHAIQACDLPSYYPTPEEDPEQATAFWDPAFWQGVADAGLSSPEEISANPYTYPMYWLNNQFELKVLSGDPTVPVAISNWGTFPAQDRCIGCGSPVPLYPAPDGWVERSYDLLLNNCFEDFSEPYKNSTMTDTDGNPVDDTYRAHFIGTNQCGVSNPIPSWFPKP